MCAMNLTDLDRVPGPTSSGTAKTKEPWNGRDWYVSFYEFRMAGAGKMRSSTDSSPPAVSIHGVP